MNHWVILPMLGPLLVVLALLNWRERRGQLGVLVTGFGGETALAVWLFGRSLRGGMEIYQPGNLLPPLGAVLVLDQLAALMLLGSAALGAAATAQSFKGPQNPDNRNDPALIQIALAGLNGAVLAGGLFTLWSVWALGLVAVAALAPSMRRQALAGAALLLSAVVVWGPLAPTLTIADLAERQAGSLPGAVLLSAAFALFLWQPGAGPAALPALGRLVAVAVLARLTLLLPLGPWPVLLALAAALPTLAQSGQRLQVALCLLVLTGFALGSQAEITAGLWALGLAFAVALVAGPDSGRLALAFQALCLTVAAGLMMLATDHWPVRVALLTGTPALILATGVAIRRCPVRPIQPVAALATAAMVAAFVVFAEPAGTHLASVARQLHNRQTYTTAVMGLPANPGPPAPTKGLPDAAD